MSMQFMWHKEVMKHCHVLCACFSNDQLYQSHSRIYFSWHQKPARQLKFFMQSLYFFKQIGQEITITDEKPNLNNNLHLDGVDRWHSTEIFAFHFSILMEIKLTLYEMYRPEVCSLKHTYITVTYRHIKK